ncbi:MAG: hypothetical protein CBD33_00070 [Euryarchaeota archaeon TMED173]|nr:MAG: hypothetical protein CBD33_00070 [Euryarchaeota archaeon TMED173]
MRQLARLQIFNSLSDYFSEIVRFFSTSRKSILILSKPTLVGALSLAPIEAALIDQSIPYKRRFTNKSPDSIPSLQIVEDLENIALEQDMGVFSLCPQIVEGLRGSRGDSRKGPLSTVAQAHAVAQIISPSSTRIRKMRPWALSGNWISESLDTTYDPVFTSIRDFLTEEGSIRIVPVTEVHSPDSRNYPWIETSHISEAKDDWNSLNFEEKEYLMDSFVLPGLNSRSTSTPRMEELLWHCVVGIDWQIDLYSQITKASELWEINSPRVASSIVTDSLISDGSI